MKIMRISHHNNMTTFDCRDSHFILYTYNCLSTNSLPNKFSAVFTSFYSSPE